ncbi:MAG: glycosyltransferase [Candidatus Moranbacteria bacterium]|nr:glycosyltransferase [Candidatus Moranbacteria bacterium]
MQISEHPEFSFIFVNHRSAEPLERAVCSVRNSGIALGSTEIIIANNDPEEYARIKELGRRVDVRTVFLPENRGFANAANVAAALANGKVLAFLNPDTEYVSGSFDYVSRFFETNKEVGVVGARLVSDTGLIEAWSAGQPLSLFRLIRNNVAPRFSKRHWEYRRPNAVGWVSGGAMFVRRETFDVLGGFDERFFLYFEDMDLCTRARGTGFRTVLLPSIVFRHDGGSSFRSDVEKKRVYHDSQDRYFAYHRPRWERILFRIVRSRFLKI